jgi:hypothetical protein
MGVLLYISGKWFNSFIHSKTFSLDVCFCLLCRFIKVLVQEFSVQLDKGFFLSVYDILSNWQPDEKSSVRMRADIALVHIPIATIAAKVYLLL